MAIDKNITGTDRTVLNVAIVAALIALALGITFLVTGWPVIMDALQVVGPVAIVAIYVGLARAWWPRNVTGRGDR